MLGSAWQRCRCTSCATCSRKCRRATPRWSRPRPALSSPARPHARPRTSRRIATMVGRQLSRSKPCHAADDATAFADFPISHWNRIRSPNPARARKQGDQAQHRRRRRVPRTPQHCCDWPTLPVLYTDPALRRITKYVAGHSRCSVGRWSCAPSRRVASRSASSSRRIGSSISPYSGATVRRSVRGRRRAGRLAPRRREHSWQVRTRLRRLLRVVHR